jgi:ABC-type multidrug transport system ATPase subunit
VERGLDAAGRADLRARLVSWAAAGRAALVATHDLGADHFTRAVRLDAGRLVDAGSFAEVARRV